MMIRIQEKIVGIGITLVIVLLITIAFLSFRQTGRADSATSRIDYTRNILMRLSNLYNTTIQHAGAARNFAFSGKQEDIQTMQSTAGELVAQLKELKKLVGNNAQKQPQADSIA